MIAQIRGPIAAKEEGALVVDVGGVGYRVYVNLIPEGLGDAEITLYTHHAVRENSQDLYGFFTLEEREMFQHLLGLPKIGPKSAMQIMSQADVAMLIKAVNEQDSVYLSKLSGIGKKTAEKIVLELKDKVGGIDSTASSLSHSDSDVIDALVSLGYPQKAARDAVTEVSSDITDTNAKVKEALRLLSQ